MTIESKVQYSVPLSALPEDLTARDMDSLAKWIERCVEVWVYQDALTRSIEACGKTDRADMLLHIDRAIACRDRVYMAISSAVSEYAAEMTALQAAYEAGAPTTVNP